MHSQIKDYIEYHVSKTQYGIFTNFQNQLRDDMNKRLAHYTAASDLAAVRQQISAEIDKHRVRLGQVSGRVD